MSAQLPATAVVIGAGFAGLATAALLAHHGIAVTVVEKNARAGGRSASLSIAGFRWDTGPSWYLMPEAFDHFFELLGTSTNEQLELVALEPGYRFFPEGETSIDVPANPRGACQLFESIEPGAGEKLAQYLNSASDSYQLAVERFLYNNFTSPRAVLHLRTPSSKGLTGVSSDAGNENQNPEHIFHISHNFIRRGQRRAGR